MERERETRREKEREVGRREKEREGERRSEKEQKHRKRRILINLRFGFYCAGIYIWPKRRYEVPSEGLAFF